MFNSNPLARYALATVVNATGVCGCADTSATGYASRITLSGGAINAGASPELEVRKRTLVTGLSATVGAAAGEGEGYLYTFADPVTIPCRAKVRGQWEIPFQGTVTATASADVIRTEWIIVPAVGISIARNYASGDALAVKHGKGAALLDGAAIVFGEAAVTVNGVRTVDMSGTFFAESSALNTIAAYSYTADPIYMESSASGYAALLVQPEGAALCEANAELVKAVNHWFPIRANSFVGATATGVTANVIRVTGGTLDLSNAVALANNGGLSIASPLRVKASASATGYALKYRVPECRAVIAVSANTAEFGLIKIGAGIAECEATHYGVIRINDYELAPIERTLIVDAEDRLTVIKYEDRLTEVA